MKIRSLVIVLALTALGASPMVGAVKGLVLTSPVGGDEWKAGTTCSIKWTGSRYGKKAIKRGGYGGKTVKIRLFKSGKIDSVIKSSTRNDGLYRWKIPSGVTTDKKVYSISISGTTTTKASYRGKKFSFKSSGVSGC